MPNPNKGVQYFSSGEAATNWGYNKRDEFKAQGHVIGYNQQVPNQYTTKVDKLADGRWVVRYGPSTEVFGMDPGGQIVSDATTGGASGGATSVGAGVLNMLHQRVGKILNPSGTSFLQQILSQYQNPAVSVPASSYSNNQLAVKRLLRVR